MKTRIKLNLTKKLLIFVSMVFFAVASLVLGVLSFTGNTSAATSYPSYFCLRDKYYIQMDDQGAYGVCWSFANTKSIEEWLAQNTGEHFELSETYYTLDGPDEDDNLPYENLVGNGGNAYYVWESVIDRNYGILLGNDLPFSDIHYLNVEDVNVLKPILKQKADSSTISSMDLHAAYLTDRTYIKYYLTNYKNCSISIDNWETQVNKKNNTVELTSGIMGGHALNVLGWDDNYSCANGTKGAFIILNSHADYDEDGIVYLPYNSSLYFNSQNVAAFSYEIKLSPDYVYLTDSNANYLVKTKYKYSKSNGFAAQEFAVAEKNMFYVDDDYNLTYTFPDRQNLEYDLTIWRGDRDVSTDFFIYKDDKTCQVMRKKDLESGSYKVKIDYSYTQNNRKVSKTILKQIFLMDGLEFNNIESQNPEGDAEWLSVDSLTLNDNNIYVTKYKNTVVNLNINHSSYSDIKSVEIKKDGQIVNNAAKILNSSKIAISIPQIDTKTGKTLLQNGDNVFELTLSNYKYSKTYNLIVQTDNYGTYNVNSGIYNKITSYLYVDLDGGKLDKQMPRKIILSNNVYYEYALEVPKKDGYIFTGYQYYSKDNNWIDIPLNNARQHYAVNKNYIRYSETGNFYSHTYQNYNYHNSIILRAIYTKEAEDDPIIIKSGQKSGNLFEFNDELTLSLNVSGATEVVWKLDGKTVLAQLGKLKAGNHILNVSFMKDGKLHEREKYVYIKFHSYDVLVDNTEFVYNKEIQKPNILIEGLVEGEDYALIEESSVNAGQYKVIIEVNDVYIKLSKNEVSYTIAPKTITITYKNQLIKQGEQYKPIEYTLEGWDESDGQFIITFDYSSVDIYHRGEYQVKVNKSQVSSNYSVVEDEPPIIVVERADFQVDNITMTSQDLFGNDTSNVYSYGQQFVIKLDCFSGMIESATYTFENFKTFNNKVQYITEKIPVGKYKVKAHIKLVNDDEFDRELNIEIAKANITVQALDAKGVKGDNPTGLRYKIISDYLVDDLDITLQIENFDKNKIGSYTIIPIVGPNNAENYNIEIVNGVYEVVKKGISRFAVILICMASVVVVICGASFVYYSIDKRRRNKELEM